MSLAAPHPSLSPLREARVARERRRIRGEKDAAKSARNARLWASIVVGQADVVLCEGGRGRTRADEVVELGALEPLLKGVVAGKAVEHVRHPPREVLDAPD